MLSGDSVGSFEELADVQTTRAVSELTAQAQAIARDLASKGLHQSGMHLVSLDKAGATLLATAAQEIFVNLMHASDAEQIADVPGRTAQLQALLDRRISLLGERLSDKVNSSGEHVRAGLANRAMVATQLTHEACEAARKELRAKVQISVRTAANRLHSAPSNVNISHSNVGSVQTGQHSTANVSQTIFLAEREDFRTAVDSLIQLLEAARGSTPEVGDAIELLEDVKAEGAKPAPNRLKIGGALTATSAVVSLVAKAPEALTNAMAAWDALRAALG